MCQPSHRPRCRPIIRKMFSEASETLTIRDMRDARHMDEVMKLVADGRCRIVNIIDSLCPDVVLSTLESLSAMKNKITELYLDIWNSEYDPLMDSLRKCLKAHEGSLESLALKCRFPTNCLSSIFEFLPKTLKTLDLSENTISDSVCLEPLVRFIQESDLSALRMLNCNVKPKVLKEFVKLLFKIESPFSLNKIEGIDFSQCDEVPVAIRKSLKEPAAATRKRQMNYRDYSDISKFNSSIQIIDYMRNTIFMKRLVGSRVRVWWPATKDDNRTAFSGRYWPADVVMVNPIDLIFVVKYDNDEVDNVPCKYIQPMNPFNYGGGLAENYLRHIIGTNRSTTTTGGLDRGVYQSLDPDSRAGTSDTGFSNLTKTPENTTSLKRGYSDVSSHSVSSTATRYEEGFICKKCGFNNLHEPDPTLDLKLDSVETALGLSDGFSGNLLVPGELVEFRDPLDQFRNDPSDYIAVVTKVNNAEPLYECLCVYQDNEELISINSRDIRRAVMIPWYNWVALAFKALIDLDKLGNKTKSVSETSANLDTATRTPNNRINTTPNTVNTRKDVKTRQAELTKSLDLSSLTDSFNSSEVTTATSEYRYAKRFHYSESVKSEADSVERLLTCYSTTTASDGGSTLEPSDKSQEFKAERLGTLEGQYVKKEPLVENYLTQTFLYPTPIDLEDMEDYVPPNPLEMKLLTLTNYSKLVSTGVQSHTKLKLNEESQSDTDNLKIRSLMEYNEILQKELQCERNKNFELQSKFRCIICFDTEINCMFDPCGHFSFCYECTQSLRNCPICRQKIHKHKILNLN